MRILIADGGTGGHIFPAIAVADELKKRKEVEGILFTGTSAGLEGEIVPRHNYELRMIHVGGLIGKGFFTRIKTMVQLPFAVFEGRKILKEFRPNVVVGFGAYPSGPVIVAASSKGIPVLLVEPNAMPGFTNRVGARFAKKVAVAYEDRANIFHGKTVITGVPVRSLTARPTSHDRFTVGVFCGSQGSRSMNDTIVAALPGLAELRDKIDWVHQTGKKDFERVQQSYKELAPFFEVTPFITAVEDFYNRCDLLICRAGAITLAELTSLGKPAILVPLPTSTHGHQEQNARQLADAGAARMVLQKDFTSELLLREIFRFLEAPEMLKAMAEASRKLGKPDAAKRVADLALQLAIKN